MPLDPNHIHADTPHAKTVHLPSQGWRYGCHSARTNDSRPRGAPTLYDAHPWAGTPQNLIITSWLPIPCGHIERSSDGAREGCANRNRK